MYVTMIVKMGINRIRQIMKRLKCIGRVLKLRVALSVKLFVVLWVVLVPNQYYVN